MSTQAVFTVIGAAVGSMFGYPQLGAVVGGALGGVVDPLEVEGPRLTDLRVTTSSYGVPLPIVYGRENRVSGNVIWSSGLKEHKHEDTQGKGGTTVTTYTYSTSVAVALSQGVCGGIKRIWGNRKLIWDVAQAGAPPPEYSGWSMVAVEIVTGGGEYPLNALGAVRFYPGDHTQTPDALIEAALGAGNVPAYRGTCYVVLENLQLADFGNALPTLEFELDGVQADNVGAAVSDIITRAGLVQGEFGINPSLIESELRGYNMDRTSNAAAALTPLQLPGKFDVAEKHGSILFAPRYRGPLATVQADLMTARQWSDGDAGDAQRITGKRAPDHALPHEVAVSYLDPDRDFQIGTQRASTARTTSKSMVTLDVPVTLSADEARVLADRALWEAFGGRTEYRFTLPPDFEFLGATDKLIVAFAEHLQLLRLTSITRGDNRVLECVAQSEDVLSYEGSDVGASSFVPVQTVPSVGETLVYVFDAPSLIIGEPDSGISYAIRSTAAGWRGGSLLRSVDGGTTWTAEPPQGVQSVVGSVSTPLGACADPYVWDEANVLTVILSTPNATLSSRSEEEVYVGNNAAWIGKADGTAGEVIQFRDATLVSASTYELRGLLRGRRGTEHAISTHVANEVFVLVSPDIVHTLDYGTADWNLLRHYSGLSIFASIANAVSQQSIANTGERAKPRSPVHIRGERDSSNNLTITWVRRTRVNGPWMGSGATPLDEGQERYEIDIVVGSAVVRTLLANSPAVIYTAAQQASDGITPGALVSGRVYQISSTRGRGHAGSFAV